MIELIDLKKDYTSKNKEVVHALQGINFNFPSIGFVGILGESGCGKSTLLNIIGGMDNLTSGDVVIDGKSIKDYKEKELDYYRNKEIGFIFQENNLINNLTLYENVSLALSLCSIKLKDRKSQVNEALKSVNLYKKAKKYPSELSGGEKQRGAIARAIVKSPSIILADEPTGSLDSANSIEIMKLLKELSKTRLVIVVSHNESLLKSFADITLTISDGKIISQNYIKNINSAAFIERNTHKIKAKMSYFDCLKISLKNILFNKIKSLIVVLAFALGVGSLGLVLSMRDGLENYIDNLEGETLARFPISIEGTGLTSENIFELIKNEGSFPDKDSFGLTETTNNFLHVNNLSDEFINYLENIDDKYKDSIRINDTTSMNFVYKDTLTGSVNTYTTSSSSFLASLASIEGGIFGSLPENSETILNDYDTLYGHYPNNENELVLILDGNNNIQENIASILGFNGLKKNDEITFKDITEIYFKLIDNNDLYKRKNVSLDESKVNAIFLKRGYDLYNENLKVSDLIEYASFLSSFNSNNSAELDLNSQKETLKELIKYIDIPEGNKVDIDSIDLNDNDQLFTLLTSLISVRYLDLYQRIDSEKLNAFYNDNSLGTTLKITGILRPKKETLYPTFNPGIYYLPKLAENFKVRNNPDFKDENSNGKIDKEEDHRSNIAKSYESNIFIRFDGTFSLCTRTILNSMDEDNNITNYLNNRKNFGLDERIVSITIYPRNFEEKSAILTYIDKYNEDKDEKNKVYATDLTNIIFSNIETLLSLISLALVAFSIICLIIGILLETIITSSLINEKKRDIGILRSLGARTNDIVNIFLSQSVVIGLISGILGIIILLIVGTILNNIINSIFTIASGQIIMFSFVVILMVLIFSIILQLLSSFIPIIINARKKPVKCIK